MADINGENMVDQTSGEAQDAYNTGKDLYNTGKNINNAANTIKDSMKNKGGDAAKGAANAAKNGSDAAQGAANAAKATSAAAKGAQGAATAAKAGAAASTAASTGAAAAGGPAAIAAAAAANLAKEAASDPTKAMGKVGGVLAIVLAPVLLISFVTFSFLSWLNPFSSTNSIAGDNPEAQQVDINEDIGEADKQQVLDYTVDNQYDKMASIIKDAVSSSYKKLDGRYDSEKSSYSNSGEYNSHDDNSRLYLKDGTYYANAANVNTEDTDPVYSDNKNPGGNSFDNSNYLIDNSNGGTMDSGIAYILASYSVSKGNTSPITFEEKYSYYNALKELVEDSDIQKSFFKYNGSLESKTKSKQVEVITLERKEYQTPVTGEANVCCPNCSLGQDDNRMFKCEYTPVSDGYEKDKNGKIKLDKNGKPIEKTKNVYVCGNCGGQFKKSQLKSQTWKEDHYKWIEVPSFQTIRYKEYSYKATISPFSYNDLIEKMFLDDNPFYKDVEGTVSGDNSTSVTITASAEQILEQVKSSWPENMDPQRVKIVKQALSGIGNLVYIWGGGHDGSYKYPRPAGVDCSGFIAWAYYNAGIDIGCVVADSYKNLNTTKVISKSELKPGDIGDSGGHVGIYVGKINGNDVWCHSSGNESNTPSNPGLGPCTNATTFYSFCTYTAFNDNQKWNSDSSSGGNTGNSGSKETSFGNFTNYTLTDTQLKGIARLCQQEQGTVAGAAAEASLMANRFELYGSKYGTAGDGLFNYVRNSRWFANSAKYMDNPEGLQDDILAVVKSVLVNGKRTLPLYIDEHDYVGDISSVTNNGVAINKSDPSQYQKDVSIIHQGSSVGSGTWIYYSHPAPGSDPFGYTSEENRQKYGDACYNADNSYSVDPSTLSRSQRLQNIMNSPYYQWGVYYKYTCEHEKSTENKCPECGAKVKTKSTGFLWWKETVPVFDYVIAKQPDSHFEKTIDDSGQLKSEASKIYSVKDKIDYYVEDMLNSIDAAGKYEGGSSGGSFTGSGSGQKLVEFALTQVGTNGSKSWDYSGFADEWCAMFVSWCADECGYIGPGAVNDSYDDRSFGEGGIIPKHWYTVAGASAFQKRGQFQYARDGYTPKPGDIVYFDWGSGISGDIGAIDHVGIVEYAEGNTIHCIEGNTGSGGSYSSTTVMQKARDTSCIVGYGTPAYPSSDNLVGADDHEKIWNYLRGQGFSAAGTAAVMGNWQQESGCMSNNVQNGMGYDDDTYTSGVNSGSISANTFIRDSRGYGLAQWTYYTRKEALYNFSKSKGAGIDDLGMQLDFFMNEVSGYGDLVGLLKSTNNVSDACYQFQVIYEAAGIPEMSNRLRFASEFMSRYK